MEAGHNGQLLHGQLLGGLLVAVAAAALDLGAAAEVFRSGEPEEEDIQVMDREREWWRERERVVEREKGTERVRE